MPWNKNSNHRVVAMIDDAAFGRQFTLLAF